MDASEANWTVMLSWVCRWVLHHTLHASNSPIHVAMYSTCWHYQMIMGNRIHGCQLQWTVALFTLHFSMDPFFGIVLRGFYIA
jgi:hypothetical protein